MTMFAIKTVTNSIFNSLLIVFPRDSNSDSRKVMGPSVQCPSVQSFGNDLTQAYRKKHEQ